MSDAFDRREEGFEKRFVMNEELRFKAVSRRNNRLGLWAAELLGRNGEAAQAYAEALVAAQIGRDDEALAGMLAADFARGGVEMSAHRIQRKIAEAMAEAVASIQAGR